MADLRWGWNATRPASEFLIRLTPVRAGLGHA